MRRTGMRPPKAKPVDRDEHHAMEAFYRDVTARAEGRSQLTGAFEWPMDPHHCVLKQHLKRLAPELVWDPDGAMLLTRTEHDRHHNGGTVIRFEQLPDYVIRWAETHDLIVMLERYHPHREPA